MGLNISHGSNQWGQERLSYTSVAATKARSFLAFIGVLSILGLDWTTTTRIIVGLALAAAIAMETSGDGHRIWPRHLRPTRYDKAA